MVNSRLSGRLAVILHADVFGSTRLVQQDEQLAHSRIQEAFRRFGEVIARYHGRVQELRGDALLAEFERASDAVSAALAFQSDHRHRLAQSADALQPGIRIGIALGEVVVADRTVTGAGVVLAQRVEQLAESGGLCITSAIHEALPARMPFALEPLGEQALKGFDDPVRVYRVTLMTNAAIPPPQDRSSRPRNRAGHVRIGLAALGLLVVAVVITYWAGERVRTEDMASAERMAFPLPDKPSIAVLPFNNLSDDAAQEYFADGITENLITDLSKVSGLFVIARNSSFSYKGKQIEVRQVAEALGVRYVMEGSVQRAGQQVRINAQLIDTTTGGHLWAERYDGSLNDIFALQDRVTTQIVTALSITLTVEEREGIGSLGTADVEAHDAYLQGLSFYYRGTPEDNARAESFFKRAVELDPGFERAYTALAKVYYKGNDWEYARALVLWWRKAVFRAHRMLAQGGNGKNADAHVVRSRIALNKHQPRVALQEADRALELNANDVDAMKAKAAALIFSGEHAAGRELAQRIIRADPVGIAEPLYLIGLSFFAAGEFEKAQDYIERAIENDPATSHYVRLLAATLGKLGNTAQANQAWKKYRKSWRRDLGQFWIAAAVQFYPFQDRKILEWLADGFEAAGGVERPPSRYLKLDPETRLSGTEIESLLFGSRIEGQDYWLGDTWRQERDTDGTVRHRGSNSFHTAVEQVGAELGKGQIDRDRLCDRWLDAENQYPICVTVFRDPDRGPDHYYMVTDTGPHPFRLVR